jgi:hypothetical protein
MLVEISEKELMLLIALTLALKTLINYGTGEGISAALACIFILTHFCKISTG